jgi:hypothetical protein
MFKLRMEPMANAALRHDDVVVFPAFLTRSAGPSVAIEQGRPSCNGIKASLATLWGAGRLFLFALVVTLALVVLELFRLGLVVCTRSAASAFASSFVTGVAGGLLILI